MMDDLILREAAIRIAECYGCNNGSALGRHSGVADCIASEIAALQAVDAAPVVHGRWRISDTGLWQWCSECEVAVERESMYMCKVSEDDNFNYCPHCGAKMDGERRESE